MFCENTRFNPFRYDAPAPPGYSRPKLAAGGLCRNSLCAPSADAVWHLAVPLFLISFCGRDRGNGAVFRSQRLYGKISINRRAEHISGAESLAPLCQLPQRKFQTAEAAGQRDRCSVKGQLRLPAVPVDFRFLRTSKWAGRPCRSPGPRRRSPRRSRY